MTKETNTPGDQPVAKPTSNSSEGGSSAPESDTVEQNNRNSEATSQQASPDEPEAAAGGNVSTVSSESVSTDGLSPYFATLLNRKTPTSRAAVMLLSSGVETILSAGNNPNTRGTDGIFGGGGNIASEPSALNPKDAALYLRAVATNVDALEEAVLRMGPVNNLSVKGGQSSVLGAVNPSGGATSKQVSDISSAVGIAATFCQSRNDITRSGILPALAYLIDRIGTVIMPSTLGNPSSTASTKKYKKVGSRGSHSGLEPMTRKREGKLPKEDTTLHALTPFHPEFLQCCLLASQYRFAQSFLRSHPVSCQTLNFSNLRLDPAMFLRYHYYAGMIHLGCDDWNSALNSFHLCLTVPCQMVSAISVAARKKSLLCQCLVLEADEVDGHGDIWANTGGGNSPIGSNFQGSGSMLRSFKSQKALVESKILDLPGALSPVVLRYMTSPADRVSGSGGGGSHQNSGGVAPERTSTGGSETSEHGRATATRRRHHSTSSSSPSGTVDEASFAERQRSRNYYQLGRYHDLVSTFISGNAEHYGALLIEMNELLRIDGNSGLAKRLESRLAYRTVRQVASVYSVVGLDLIVKNLEDFCAGVGSAGSEIGKWEIEDALMGIASQDWDNPLVADPFCAKIDHLSGMVSFQSNCADEDVDESDDSDEEWMEHDLSNRLESCISLAGRVRDLDISLATSPKYLQHVMKEMVIKGDHGSMKQGQGVADIGHGPMDAFD